jgi:hypothetical protein
MRRYAMDKFGLGPAEADRRVSEMNRQREQYVKRHWNRNWLAHENYHLCIDTSWLGTEGAAQLIVEAARRQFALAVAD